MSFNFLWTMVIGCNLTSSHCPLLWPFISSCYIFKGFLKQVHIFNYQFIFLPGVLTREQWSPLPSTQLESIGCSIFNTVRKWIPKKYNGLKWRAKTGSNGIKSYIFYSYHGSKKLKKTLLRMGVLVRKMNWKNLKVPEISEPHYIVMKLQMCKKISALGSINNF